MSAPASPLRAQTAGAGAPVSQAGELRSARLESLRAIAALGVLEGHVFGQAHGWGPSITSGYLHRVLLGGGFGVYLFFVLSGYLLYWPFARQTLDGGEPVHLGRYALNRVLRILPLYYVVLIALLLVQEHGGSAEQWWRFGLFAENFSTRSFATVDGTMWSLVVELHFYALLPLLAYLVGRLARGSLRRAALCLGMAGGAAFALRVSTVQLSAHPDTILRYSLPSLFGFFAIGMLIAVLRLAWARRTPSWAAGAAGHADAWLLASAVVWGLVFWRYDLEPAAGVASFLMIGACVLPLRSGHLLVALEWRALALIGVSSYSLYLWHIPIVVHVGTSSWAPSGFPALLALLLALCLAAAALSYVLVEAPFLRLRRRWSPAAASASAT
jgi:peptidoglycan/LPS O-acetylase OafA/YrhL